jgi:putative endonuclease
MPYFTYILECSDTTLYVGCTNNLIKRLNEHNNSKAGAHYTKIRRPVTLKYFEKFDTLSAARKREVELKKYTRDKKLKLFESLNARFIIE